MVLDAVNQLKLRSTILDGEIVALDAEGIPPEHKRNSLSADSPKAKEATNRQN